VLLKSDLTAQQSLTKIKSVVFVNWVTLKAGAMHELLFNKLDEKYQNVDKVVENYH
jgi:hypothetical protein